MLPCLGAKLWDDFVHDVTEAFRDDFVALFAPEGGILRCAGPLDGGACPSCVEVDFARGGVDRLASLHLDHE